MQLTSPAFVQGSVIPSKYTCDGDNISPPVEWADAPTNAQSFALVMDDPDAPSGTFDHWVLFNLPKESTALSEGVSPIEALPNGALQGKNSFGDLGYGGPCPPVGTHRYYFRLYALDKLLNLDAGSSKRQVLDALARHILAQSELMGRYSKRPCNKAGDAFKTNPHQAKSGSAVNSRINR